MGVVGGGGGGGERERARGVEETQQLSAQSLLNIRINRCAQCGRSFVKVKGGWKREVNNIYCSLMNDKFTSGTLS